MHMSISLLTAKRQNIEPFGWHHLSDGFSYLINEPLKLKVLLQGKVTGDMFTVISWSDQGVASERRVFVQKHHGGLILINQMVRIGPSDKFTDKAGTIL